MALTAPVPRDFVDDGSKLTNDVLIPTGTKVFEGGALGDNAGAAVPCSGASYPFVGISEFTQDNTAGDASLPGSVRAQGVILLAVITGATGAGDVRKPVYASADNTFTLTASGAVLIGTIIAFRNGFFLVFFQAATLRKIVAEDIAAGTLAVARLPALVGDSGSGGTAGIAPAPGSGDAAAGKFLQADGTYKVPISKGTKVTAAAPYANDGYVVVTFPDGTTVRLGTVA